MLAAEEGASAVGASAIEVVGAAASEAAASVVGAGAGAVAPAAGATVVAAAAGFPFPAAMTAVMQTAAIRTAKEIFFMSMMMMDICDRSTGEKTRKRE